MRQKTVCPLCGQETPPNARFCPSCGAGLQDPRRETGLLAPRRLLRNRYAIDRKLAQGGQSAVYLARDTLDNNIERAIKEMSESNLNPEERQKAVNDFMREARMLYNLNHPALARVYDIFLEDNKYYLVMEYVPGHNLEDEMVVVRKEPLEWDAVTRWGIALCDVLAYLHAQQPPIIYRDLKPANVMLRPDQSIKLIDFGIARWLHPLRLTDTMQLGTDGYAPLEQYSAHSEPRSDIYALGASLYHLMTGRVPEAAPLRTAGRMLTPIRAVNPRVPEPVERVIHQALNLKASDRFANDDAMRDALEWALRAAQGGVGGRASTSGGHPSAPGRFSGAPSYAGQIGQTAPSSAMNGASGANGASGKRPAVGGLASAAGVVAGVVAGRRTGAAPPHLYVWPLRLDVGAIEAESVTRLELEVANRGGGRLSGEIKTNLECLTVEPAVIDEDTTSLEVSIDTTGLAIGPYVCHVALWTNGGDQIIQVRFEVRPRGDPRVARGLLTGL